MDQLVFDIYSGTIQFQVERDLKIARLSAIISPYLAKLIKHNKSNTSFLHDIAIFFPFFLSETADMISSCNLSIIQVSFKCNDHFMNL